MKILNGILFILSLSTSAHAQKYKGDSWSSISEKGSGVLSVVYYTQPGLIYKDHKTGEIKGVCVNILNDFVAFVKREHNKTITINYVGEEKKFSEFLASIQLSQNVLGVSNITVTDQRSQVLSFTPAFLGNPIIMLTHKDAPSVTNLSELKVKFSDYSAEVIKGSTHEEYMNRIKNEHIPSVKIQMAPSGSTIMDHIALNPKIFTIMDLTEFIYAVRNKLPLKKQNIKIVEKEEQLAFAMKKGSDWTKIWRSFLTDEYKNSVTYKKHIAEHLGTGFLSILATKESQKGI